MTDMDFHRYRLTISADVTIEASQFEAVQETIEREVVPLLRSLGEQHGFEVGGLIETNYAPQ